MESLNATVASLGLTELPTLPNTHPDYNILDIYRSHIASLVENITKADINIIQSSLSWTQTLDKGDLTLPVPALRLKSKPNDLAQEICDKFPESPLVEKPSVEKSFVKFFFKPEPLTKVLVPSILRKGASFGFNETNGLQDASDPSKGKKKILIEFSSPNIAKPFHAGHLRSTIIGGFLSHLYASAGWDVIRMNYLGDWGKQYGVLAIGFQKYGSEDSLLENPIKHLYDVYVKVSSESRDELEQMEQLRKELKSLKEKDDKDAEVETEISKKESDLQQLIENSLDEQARKYFKRMVEGDETALNLWRKFRDLSIKKYKDTYSRLNIQFDEFSGESQITEDSMKKVLEIMEEQGVSERSDGAVIVDFNSKKLGKAIIQKKDGTSLYLSRDISAAMQRYEKYKFDKMLYVVASQQELHLAQLFRILENIGRTDISQKCRHIMFGMVLGMSTRKGTAKFLDDILQDVGEKMHEVMKTNEAKYKQIEDPEHIADILAISAVMVQDMRAKKVNNYEFDINRMTSFEGDTGPYLQYAHARLSSITRKAALERSDLFDADLSLLKEPHAVNLVRALSQWPDVVQNTLRTEEPSTILTYLFKMTHALSSSYDHLQVVGSEEEVKRARLSLYEAARQILQNGMRLLGLTPVERM